jgi:hypothetical protein
MRSECEAIRGVSVALKAFFEVLPVIHLTHSGAGIDSHNGRLRKKSRGL